MKTGHTSSAISSDLSAITGMSAATHKHAVLILKTVTSLLINHMFNCVTEFIYLRPLTTTVGENKYRHRLKTFYFQSAYTISAAHLA